MAATLKLGTMVLKVTKGNKLQDSTTEDHTAGSFQPYMYDGLDRNKAVRLIEQIALLGVRSDYLEIQMFVKTASSDGNDLLTESVYIEGVEWSGVPPNVQYGVFGQDSPFATADFNVSDGMMIGVDKQELQFTNNVEVTSPDAYTTAMSQKIRGVTDDRITVYGDKATVEACTIFTLKIQPNSDGVFLLRAGAVIWMQPGAADKV